MPEESAPQEPLQETPKEPLRKMGCLPVLIICAMFFIGLIGMIYLNFK